MLLLNHMQPALQKSGLLYGADAVRTLLDYPVLGEIPEDRAVALGAARGMTAQECTGAAHAALVRASAAVLSRLDKEQE